jgi:hypothetical protein
MTFVCDATLCTDGAGTPGRIDAIVSTPEGACEESVSVGCCSADRVEIWHGASTPAIACGKHATYSKVAVFRGHRNRWPRRR